MAFITLHYQILFTRAINGYPICLEYSLQLIESKLEYMTKLNIVELWMSGCYQRRPRPCLWTLFLSKQ